MEINVPLILHEPLDEAHFKEMGYGKQQRRIAMRVARNVYLRTRVSEAQNWRCCWCGVKCDARRGRDDSSTIEHVQPKSLGGPDEWENMALACSHCNGQRGTQDADKFVPGRPVHITMPKKDYASPEYVERMIKRAAILAARGWTSDDNRISSRDEWMATLRPTTQAALMARLPEIAA